VLKATPSGPDKIYGDGGLVGRRRVTSRVVLVSEKAGRKLDRAGWAYVAQILLPLFL
jgi:hypothetical protein